MSVLPTESNISMVGVGLLGRTTSGAGKSSRLTAAAVRSLCVVYSTSEVDTLLAGYQPLDSDLTAIAALTTTSFGRSLLTQADAAAARTAIGAGTSSFDGAYSSLTGIPSTFTPSAHNQAWSTITSTPTTLAGYGITDAITSAAVAAGYQPLDSDLTAIAALTTTSFGRSLLTQADAAAVRTTIGAGTSSFDGAFSSLTGKPTTVSGYGITNAYTKTEVDNLVAGLLDFKGNLDCSTNPNYPSALKGDSYYVSVAGKIGGASGVSVEVGDLIVCSADNAGGTQASVGSSWFVLEKNLNGALISSNNLSDLANAATARSNLGLGTLATQNGTFSGTSSGTNTGDQTITLTGDVTGSGTGSFAATISAGAVTLAKQANVATGTVFYRKTAGTGSPEVQTLATLKTDLGLTGTNSGDQTITLTGDVTGSGTGSFAATIANDSVTLAKMANIATASFLGRVTAATGDPEVLTGTQATTLLDVFTSSLKGLAPASGGGTSNFLRADGTWAAPAGGGDALTSNPLSQFAATTSSQLAGVISDETGTGSLVFATSPTLVTPTLGVATATSINKVAVTAPATSATLTIADGATLTASATATVSGSNTGDQTITLTGDVTGSGTGSFAATIGAGTVTNAKLANVATSTFKGRVTAGTGSPEDLTGTQATTLLDVFTSSLKGLAPASGGGTTNFLRADGTWAAPAGGSGLTSLNSQTGSTQTFATGTSGTDFGISSSGDVHTFNLPDAGASARGLVTTGTQTFAGAKTFNSQVIVPSGSASSVGIGVETDTGMYSGYPDQLYFAAGGSPAFKCLANLICLNGNGSGGIRFNGGLDGSSTGDIVGEGGNAISFRNGSNAQTVNIANTWTSSTNFEYGRFQWNTNEFRIGTAVGSAGGTVRDIVIGAWNSAGTFVPGLIIQRQAAGADEYLYWRGGTSSNSTSVGLRASGVTNYIYFGGNLLCAGGTSLNNNGIFYPPLRFTPNAQTSGAITEWQWTAAAHTGQTASTEAPSVVFDLSATKTFAAGALTTQRAFRIQAPTYAFASASTITSAATLSISGAPVAGTNATLTNSYALWVENGMSQFSGIVNTAAAVIINAGSQAFNTSFHFLSWNGGFLGWSSSGTVNSTSSLDTAFRRVSAGLIEINNGTAATYRDLILRNLTTTGTATIGAYTLPATDGTNGQVLQTNGAGSVSWATVSGGGGGSGVSEEDAIAFAVAL